MIIFSKDTFAYRLISLLAAVGELPYSSLPVMGYANTCRRKVRQMAGEETYLNQETNRRLVCKALLLSGKGKSKKIRLSQSSYTLLEWIGCKDYYLNKTAKRISGSQSHHTRAAKIAEAAAMMNRAGAEILPSELVPISNSMHNAQKVTVPSFYNSMMLKTDVYTDSKKDIYSRYVGMLIYPGQSYAVYNTRDEIFRWHGQSEIKIRYILERTSICSGGSLEILAAIMFGKDYNTALAILDYVNNPANSNRANIKTHNYRFDKIYNRTHFIELNDNGFKFLQTMLIPGWLALLRDMFFTQEERKGAKYNAFDAMHRGKQTCLFLDHNITKLNGVRPIVDSSIFHVSEEEVLIVCYPHQEDFVRKVVGDGIEIKTISFEKVLERYKLYM